MFRLEIGRPDEDIAIQARKNEGLIYESGNRRGKGGMDLKRYRKEIGEMMNWMCGE